MIKIKTFMALIISMFIVIGFCFAGCDLPASESYQRAESKTFSNENFTITATVDYEKSDTYQTEDCFILEGLRGESIVLFYNKNTSTYSTQYVNLDHFTQDVINICNFSVENSDIKEITINQEIGYTNIRAKYFTQEISKRYYNDLNPAPAKEKFNIHYTNMGFYNNFKWIVLTAQVENAFVVGYIGGQTSTFNQKFDEYLDYAKSLLVKNVLAKSITYNQNLFNEGQFTTDGEHFSDLTGFNITLPNITYFNFHESITYVKEVDIYMAADNGIVPNNVGLWVALKGYGSNWTRDYDYCPISGAEKNSEYGLNPNLIFIGTQNNVGLMYKIIAVGEDHSAGPGVVQETLYFKLKIQDRIYAFQFSCSIPYEGDTSSSTYSNYKYHSSDDAEIYEVLDYIEAQVFKWIKSIELTA